MRICSCVNFFFVVGCEPLSLANGEIQYTLSLANGEIQYTSPTRSEMEDGQLYATGSIASLKCYKGFFQSGPKTLICTIFNTWVDKVLLETVVTEHPAEGPPSCNQSTPNQNTNCDFLKLYCSCDIIIAFLFWLNENKNSYCFLFALL